MRFSCARPRHISSQRVLTSQCWRHTLFIVLDPRRVLARLWQTIDPVQASALCFRHQIIKYACSDVTKRDLNPSVSVFDTVTVSHLNARRLFYT